MDSFRPLLDKGYAQEHKSNAGRKRIDPLTLFKMLVLQQLFNLSDEELEYQFNDRRSIEEYVGLGVMNSCPASTPLAGGEENVIAHGCRRRQPGGNGGGSDTKNEPGDSQSLCQHWVAPIGTRRQAGWPVGCRDLC